MTEFEKMVGGFVYDPTDGELREKRGRAHRAANEYNRTDEAEQERRYNILHGLLGGAGEDLYMEPAVRFDYGCNLYIGDDCYFNFDSIFCDCARIQIGNRVMVGPRCSFLTPMHPLVAAERITRTDESGRKYNLEYCRPITIEDNVWLCGNVTVNGGVTIGRDSVIGSGSVVTRDIPAGVLAAGVPCRVIRPITKADRILRQTDKEEEAEC